MSVERRVGPQLSGISLSDRSQDWEDVGFTVTDGRVMVGRLTVALAQPNVAAGWWFSPELPGDVDQIETTASQPAAGVLLNPNGANAVDHVVVTTPDLDRTTTSLVSSGFPVRRSRPVGDNEQRFFWAGDTIIELVGPLKSSDEGPAKLWGLALVSDDLGASKQHLGDALSDPRDAVQPGRRIAAIRTKEHAISVTIALMTPHAKARTNTI